MMLFEIDVKVRLTTVEVRAAGLETESDSQFDQSEAPPERRVGRVAERD